MSLYLLALLAGLMAMTPLAVDAYLPAIPAMSDTLSASVHSVELTVSIFLAGFSLGQVIGGPLSDHFGRRPMIFAGLTLFIVGALGIASSSTLEFVWVFRLVQALGGGIAGVNPIAIVRDISQGVESARNLAHMAVIMMVAPLVAPLIGVTILEVSSWRGIFYFLAIYALVIAVTAYFRIPETRRAGQEPLTAIRRYLQVVSHKYALGYLFSAGFAAACMFAFITASPSVYMEYFGVDETLYPFLFGANVFALIIVNRINVVLIRRFDLRKLIFWGQGMQILAGFALASYCGIGAAPALVPTVLLVMSVVAAQALIVSNANASAIEFFPGNSGTAAALMGASSFAFGGMAGGLVALFSDGTPLAMAVVMFACALTGLLLRLVCQRSCRVRP